MKLNLKFIFSFKTGFLLIFWNKNILFEILYFPSTKFEMKNFIKPTFLQKKWTPEIICIHRYRSPNQVFWGLYNFTNYAISVLKFFITGKVFWGYFNKKFVKFFGVILVKNLQLTYHQFSFLVIILILCILISQHLTSILLWYFHMFVHNNKSRNLKRFSSCKIQKKQVLKYVSIYVCRRYWRTVVQKLIYYHGLV
eukprot:TRINITY_DN17381_c0_g1_i2.p3 TRINITY_DN17381_c0_g1~~TRINITY_DN17381_c0_g1_i2.p3  ORF type:complete len:196 (-),score=-8.03 TRINITY_DN17381_c0_g1_i2:441-1028(-)